MLLAQLYWEPDRCRSVLSPNVAAVPRATLSTAAIMFVHEMRGNTMRSSWEPFSLGV